jgi:predicted transcriptional regulator
MDKPPPRRRRQTCSNPDAPPAFPLQTGVTTKPPYGRNYSQRATNRSSNVLKTKPVNKTTLAFTARIVSVFVANNTVRADQLPALIQDVHRTLSTVGEAPAKAEPAVEVRKSIFPDRHVCLGCGGSFKTLKKHIMTEHQMMPEQYRPKFELPPRYPMVSPAYSKVRSAISKKVGLGHWRTQKKARRKRGDPADVRSICLLHAH